MNYFKSRNFCERHVGRKCPIERAFVENIYTVIIITVPVDARAIVDIFFLAELLHLMSLIWLVSIFFVMITSTGAKNLKLACSWPVQKQ